MPNIQVKNNAYATLASGINTTDVTFSVAAGTGVRFPALSAGQYFYATLEDIYHNIEIVKVTARVVDLMTVVRAQEGTTALAFPSGSAFELRMTAQTISDLAGAAVQTTGATGSAAVPSGTTAERDATPSAGYFRFNSSTGAFEGFNGTSWGSVGGMQTTGATGSAVGTSGTTAERDGTPSAGYFRFNTTLGIMEVYDGTNWGAAGLKTNAGGTQVAVKVAGVDKMTVNAAGEVAATKFIGDGSALTGIVTQSAAAFVKCDGTRNVTDTGASTNGAPVKIRKAFNVASVTKNAVGDFTVNFSTAMPDADYVVVAFFRSATVANLFMSRARVAAPTTAAYRFDIYNSGIALQDCEEINLVFYT